MQLQSTGNQIEQCTMCTVHPTEERREKKTLIFRSIVGRTLFDFHPTKHRAPDNRNDIFPKVCVSTFVRRLHARRAVYNSLIHAHIRVIVEQLTN